MKTGLQLIAAERARQIASEGWTPEHDDEHTAGELGRAAMDYTFEAVLDNNGHACGDFPKEWPWEDKWWKPSKNPIRNLQKAGALIAAEIDRLQRARRREAVDIVLAVHPDAVAHEYEGRWSLYIDTSYKHRLVCATSEDDAWFGAADAISRKGSRVMKVIKLTDNKGRVFFCEEKDEADYHGERIVSREELEMTPDQYHSLPATAASHAAFSPRNPD